MNCAKGDLAIVMESEYPENVGVTVRVLRLAEPGGYGPRWYVRALTGHTLRGVAEEGRLGCREVDCRPDDPNLVCADAVLQPIRPPRRELPAPPAEAKLFGRAP
jgi:hypothetical protein